MGDLVESERATDTRRLHRVFNEAVERHNETYAKQLASPLTITLGDEFQGLVTSLTEGAQLMRDLRLSLLLQEVDCRFVLGLAAIETAVNPRQAWNMMGSGLGRSRRKLAEKRVVSRYGFSLPQDPLAEKTLDALGVGLTLIERGWTYRQLADIAALLDGHTPAELAARREVSIHSIYKVRSSGHFEPYVMQWEAVMEGLATLNAQRIEA